MKVDIPTYDAWLAFKKEFFEEFKKMYALYESSNRLLKSSEVCKMLRISPGKLQSMRNAGQIEFIEIGNSFLYELKHVQTIIASNRKRKGGSCLIYGVIAPCIPWLSDLGQLCS